MASTTAMYTALTGLSAASFSLDVIGNNIANVNTTAYKGSRVNFQTLFSRTLRIGSPPSDSLGGSNPTQVGYGVGIAGTQRNMTSGTTSATGNPRDLAIEGNGLFVIDRGGEQVFTRAGAFQLSSSNELVTTSGDFVMGYGVDSAGTIATGSLTKIQIPLGSATIAEATQNVRMAGNLDASGLAATHGARINILGTATSGLRTIAGATPAPTPPNVLEAASRLVDIEDPLQPLTNAPLFAVGQILEMKGAEQGTGTLATTRLDITGSTTVQELMDFLTASLSINTDITTNPDGGTPGLALDPTTGIMTITGNTGTVNDLSIDASDLRLLDAGGGLLRTPFAVSKAASADGESVRTTFIVYDSLGTPVAVDVAMVLEGKSNSGTQWRYFAQSDDDSDDNKAVGSGVIQFDTEGQIATTQPASITVDRNGTGAVSPLTFDLAFGGGEDTLTALTDTDSNIAATYRDGSPIGTLIAFGVGPDGTINGAFSNGLTRVLGQVALAKFANAEGLVDLGNNLFAVGPNSGAAQITSPGSLGTGKIVGGALELSNVDIGQEFISLITASTGYSASARVIQTTNDLFQQLLVLGR